MRFTKVCSNPIYLCWNGDGVLLKHNMKICILKWSLNINEAAANWHLSVLHLQIKFVEQSILLAIHCVTSPSISRKNVESKELIYATTLTERHTLHCKFSKQCILHSMYFEHIYPCIHWVAVNRCVYMRPLIDNLHAYCCGHLAHIHSRYCPPARQITPAR